MHVTPSEGTYRLLSELQRLTGKPPATIVRELLDEAAPALEIMLEAYRGLHSTPNEAREAVLRLAAQGHAAITQATLDLDTNKKPGRKPRKQGREAANTG